MSTQSVNISRCRKILYKNINKELQGEDFSFLRKLIDFHPDAKKKIGSGVSLIYVAPSKRKIGQYCFWIKRRDESTTDFSFLKCLKKRPYKTEVKQSLRCEVEDQIIRFKNKYFAENQNSKGYVKCPETGLKIKIYESHADHHPEGFDSLVNRFIELENLIFQDIKISGYKDNSTRRYLLDENLKRKWQNFHQREAKLRILFSKANLQKKRKFGGSIMAKEWVKPIAGNNWGRISVYAGEPAKTSWGTWATDPGVPEIKAGKQLLRYPDGSEAITEVFLKTRTESVSDHGNTYTVDSKVPHIMIELHGVQAAIPLHESGCEVERSTYE